MPENTVVPSARREAAPAPVAMRSGATPKMKASEVMMIGLNRNSAAASADFAIDMPLSWRSLAYSTIKIAFFEANPMRVTIPI